MWKIISGFLGWVISPIVNVLNFPVIPEGVISVFSTALNYISASMGIVNWFVPLNLVWPAVSVFLACFVIEHGYTFIMWVLKKIPLFGIS